MLTKITWSCGLCTGAPSTRRTGSSSSSHRRYHSAKLACCLTHHAHAQDQTSCDGMLTRSTWACGLCTGGRGTGGSSNVRLDCLGGTCGLQRWVRLRRYRPSLFRHGGRLLRNGACNWRLRRLLCTFGNIAGCSRGGLLLLPGSLDLCALLGQLLLMLNTLGGLHSHACNGCRQVSLQHGLLLTLG